MGDSAHIPATPDPAHTLPGPAVSATDTAHALPAPLYEGDPRHGVVEKRSLWFGFTASAFAWIALGCFDIVVTWRACMLQEEFGVPKEHATATALYLLAALVLLSTTVSAGWTSYRNWRRLATMPDIVRAHAVERREFMAAAGVLVALTLGVSMVWLALPPLFLDLCWRAR